MKDIKLTEGNGIELLLKAEATRQELAATQSYLQRGRGFKDLSDADLSGAYLSGATGNLTHVKSLHADRWAVTYTADRMFIGCQAHPLTDWWGFDDRTINAMDIGALKWWRKWKPILQAMVEASPAEPTKVETEQAV